MTTIEGNNSESQPSGKSAEECLNDNKPYGRNWSDFLLPDQMEFLYRAMEQYANQQPVNDGWVRVDSERGCGTCKHIANDGKYPCNVCGDGDYVMYEPLPEPPKQ